MKWGKKGEVDREGERNTYEGFSLFAWSQVVNEQPFTLEMTQSVFKFKFPSFCVCFFYQIYSSSSKDQRGIHVVILNQATVCC